MAIPSVSQASFAAALLLSIYWSYIALTPPHPPTAPTFTPSKDVLKGLHLTKRHATLVVLAPTALLALHMAYLALYPPAHTRINRALLTWSPATLLPLALLLGVAIPLRLQAYAVLGANFTFALTAPQTLYTDGVYQYIQHPGYTSFVMLVACHWALFYRTDGVQSAWFSEGVYARRVREEEGMLSGLFGAVWDEWHANTARFVPYVF
ncbi:hypothetical protein B0T25DRAFT_515769 [Lasiosphaeria hispida]|uniref:Protein-S-isoprenylcysteine O-methyltransferase n=1 Tax=Lasiosphaeria hispida TaxID=260671 RepID=A0AAJ0MIR8_9PEZI|nr:hypothetical protein B0T25DRAFT_515769 [Lasiosphaeria hispida]